MTCHVLQGSHDMSCDHYPDLSSVSDWLKMCFNQSAALLGLLLQVQFTDTQIKDLHLILGLVLIEATTLIESQLAVHVHVEIFSPNIAVIILFSFYLGTMELMLLPLVILLGFPVTVSLLAFYS